MLIVYLILAYTLGLLIALPQLIPAVRYWPKSIRIGQTARDKQTIGSVPPTRLLKGLFTTRIHDQVDGVFYPEVCTYVGILGFIFALFSTSWHQWILATLAGCIAIGRYCKLFHWCSPLMLRIPARMCYFLNLALVFMAVAGLSRFQFTSEALWVICLLQAFDLATNSSSLWPMQPFVQKWEKPSKTSHTLLIGFLYRNLGTYKVSGLPFPLSTGQIHGFRTLGYKGGSTLKSVARFHGTSNPMGDWTGSQINKEDLDWFGVRYSYSYRPLERLGWIKTEVAHLYLNPDAQSPKTWLDLEKRYGHN